MQLLTYRTSRRSEAYLVFSAEKPVSRKRRSSESSDSDSKDWSSCKEAELSVAEIEDGLRSCQLLSKKYGEIAKGFYSNLVGSLPDSAPQQTLLVESGSSCLLASSTSTDLTDARKCYVSRRGARTRAAALSKSQT